MTKSGNDKRSTKLRPQERSRGAAGTGADPEAGAAGRTAYRDEYQRDHGPDLDEPLDGIESGHEF